jgi:hypothetical protein
LLTSAQQRTLRVVQDGERDDESDALGSPACTWDLPASVGTEGYLARLITQRSADYYLDSEKPVQVVDIEGFAAVQTTSATAPSDQDHCLVLVDVAVGQTLWTQYDALLAQHPGVTREFSCARARDGAQAMMSTLKSLRKPAN